MEIRVNDESRSVPDGCTVAELIGSFDLAPERVAIELNERLVQRGAFAETRLAPGDRVEIVTLVGGGAWT